MDERIYRGMQFAEYVRLFEAAPMPQAGIGAPAAPLGGPMGFGGGPLGAGMGPAPMPPGGMGAPPPGGSPLDMGAGSPEQPPPSPPTNVTTKDVWQVLDKLLSKQSKSEKTKEKQPPVF